MSLALLLSFLLALLIGPAAPLLQQKTVAWDRYDVDMALQQNGDFLVTETQAIDFRGGPFTTAFRQIPLDQTTGITDVQVGEPGRTYKSGSGTNSFRTSKTSDNQLRVDWNFPPTTNAKRTFILTYPLQ